MPSPIARSDSPAAPTARLRHPGRMLALLVVLSGAGLVALLLRFGPTPLDDGYYYFQIAHHLAAGRGFTFDGLHATNGFHPLWQLLLVPVYWLSDDKTAAVYAVTWLQIACFLGSGVALYALTRRLSGSPAAALLTAALWLLNFWFWNKGALSGVETGLLVLCYGLALLALHGVVARSLAPGWLGGALLLLVAARVDALAFAAAAAGLLLLLGRGRAALLALAPTALYLAVYFGINQATLGHFVPISGYVKSAPGRALVAALLEQGDFTLLEHLARNLTQFITLRGRIPLVVSLGGLGVGLVALVWLLRRIALPGRVVLLAHGALVGGLLLYYGAMYSSLFNLYSYYWYTAIYGGLPLLALGLTALPWPALRRGAGALALAGTLGFNVVYGADMLATYKFSVPPDQYPEAQVVAYLNAELDDDARIASWDAGYLGYYSARPVINLDGLVNTFEYLDYVEDHGLQAYLDREGVTHLANVGLRDPTRVGLPAAVWTPVYTAQLEGIASTSRFSALLGGAQRGPGAVREVTVFARATE